MQAKQPLVNIEVFTSNTAKNDKVRERRATYM